MKLKTKKRSAERKGDSNQLRREGSVPAVVYDHGKVSLPIAVDLAEFEAILRKIPSGRLATTKIALCDEEGKEHEALVKDIQYEPTTYKIIHLDFEILQEKVKVKVNVPIECTGIADCVGVKLGGVPRQVIRSLRVQCFPKDLPSKFTLDVAPLGLKGKRRLSDIQIPEGVRPLATLSEVAVVIAKR